MVETFDMILKQPGSISIRRALKNRFKTKKYHHYEKLRFWLKNKSLNLRESFKIQNTSTLI